MRVNISYSLDLEDIPRAISHLIHENIEKLDGIVAELDEADQELKRSSNVVDNIKKIDNLRKKMYGIDMSLADIVMILSERQRVINQQFIKEQVEVDNAVKAD